MSVHVNEQLVNRLDLTILMRTADFAMELTVVNQDSVGHTFYIDELNLMTRFLEPGQSEVLTFIQKAKRCTTITTTKTEKSRLIRYRQSK